MGLVDSLRAYSTMGLFSMWWVSRLCIQWTSATNGGSFSSSYGWGRIDPPVRPCTSPITSYKTRHLTPFRRAALPLPVACSAPLPSPGRLRREAVVLPHHALWLGELHPRLAGRQGLPGASMRRSYSRTSRITPTRSPFSLLRNGSPTTAPTSLSTPRLFNMSLAHALPVQMLGQVSRLPEP